MTFTLTKSDCVL